MKKSGIIFLLGVFGLTGCGNMSPGETFGGLFGATSGALIGSQIGGGSGRIAATAIGTILGGMIGTHFGRTLDEQSRKEAARTTSEMLYNIPPERTGTRRWESGRIYGYSTISEEYRRDNGYYRDVSWEATLADGRKVKMFGRARHNPDGTWEMLSER